MIYIPNEKMFVNKFTDVKLPSKAEIFARTGQRAVSPNGVYTKEEPARFGASPTESAESFVEAAESYEVSNSEE